MNVSNVAALALNDEMLASIRWRLRSLSRFMICEDFAMLTAVVVAGLLPHTFRAIRARAAE